MNHKLLIKILCCVAVFGLYLFNLLQKQNHLSQLGMMIPSLSKDVKEIEEDNIKLKYEICAFESPENLFKLVRQKEFTHLKYPLFEEVIKLNQGIAIKFETPHTSDRAAHANQSVLASQMR